MVMKVWEVWRGQGGLVEEVWEVREVWGSGLIEIKNAKHPEQTRFLLGAVNFNKAVFLSSFATVNGSQIGTMVFSRMSLRTFSASAVRVRRPEIRELTMMRWAKHGSTRRLISSAMQ